MNLYKIPIYLRKKIDSTNNSISKRTTVIKLILVHRIFNIRRSTNKQTNVNGLPVTKR